VKRQPAPADSYYDHNARAHREVPLDVVEWDDPSEKEIAILVEERRISREEFDALLLEAIRNGR
jgi:hypothetical protein